MRLLALVILALMQAACAAVPVPDAARLADMTPRHDLRDLPLIPQEDRYCGPAALATVLQYHGQPFSQAEAAEMVFTPGRGGTFQHDMVAALRRRGLLALPVRTPDDMIRAAAADVPVIVFQNLGLSWVPAWHYAVLAGYDLPQEEFILHGGRARPRRLSFHTLGATWARAGSWAYAVSLPEAPPAFARPEDVAEAAAGLEGAGQAAAAEAAYRALLDRYPDIAAGWFGLGNVYLARGAAEDAGQAYRRAMAIDPGHDAAANNLAYALARQGRVDAACALLRVRAARPGPHRDALRDSLSELCMSPAGAGA